MKKVKERLRFQNTGGSFVLFTSLTSFMSPKGVTFANGTTRPTWDVVLYPAR